MNAPALVAAARRVGLHPHDLVLALQSPPLPGRRRPTAARKLSPAEVADLKARFAARPAGRTAEAWFHAEARRLLVGHATVRRAVYGFASYAGAKGGVS